MWSELSSMDTKPQLLELCKLPATSLLNSTLPSSLTLPIARFWLFLHTMYHGKVNMDYNKKIRRQLPKSEYRFQISDVQISE
jgi:hypothetical protein